MKKSFLLFIITIFYTFIYPQYNAHSEIPDSLNCKLFNRTLNGYITDLEIVDDSIIFISSTYSFHIFKNYIPDSIVEISKIDFDGYINSITITGEYAYISNNKKGLQILDISDFNDIKLLYSFDTPGLCKDVFIKDSFAYISDDSSGMIILNIKDKSSPIELASIKVPGRVLNVFVDDLNYAYLSLSNDSGVEIIDVSNLDSITHVSDIPVYGNFANSVIVRDSLAFVCGILFEVYNIKDRKNPQLLNSIDLTGYLGHIKECIINNNIAYVSCENGLFYTLDIQTPTNLKIMDYTTYTNLSMGEYGTTRGLCLLNNNIYNNDELGNMHVLDISDPNNISEFFSYTTGNPLLESYIYNSNIFIGDNAANFYIFDKNINEISKTKLHFSPTDISVYNNIVSLGGIGTLLYDITDKSNPIYLSDINTISSDITNYIYKNILAINDWNNGLKLYDISNPNNPAIISQYTQNTCNGSIIEDTILYFIDYYSGLYILNIANPENPILISQYTLPTGNDKLLKKENYIFVSNTNTLYIIDITNINFPILISTYISYDYNNFNDIFIDNNYVFISDYKKGILILDISDIEHTLECGYYNMLKGVSSCVEENNLIYCATNAFGLTVLEFNSELAKIYNRETVEVNYIGRDFSIELNILESTSIIVEIYNLLGNRILYKDLGEYNPGTYIENINIENSGNYIYKIYKNDRLEKIGHLIIIK